MTTDIDYAVNVKRVLDRALFCEYVEGTTWYARARDIAAEIADGDVWKGAGVLAAFSPRQPWPVNVRNARHAFETGIATGHTRAMCSLAQRILDGEPTMDVLKGDKTRQFASGIATGGQSDLACIDRHAHDIAMGSFDFTDSTRNIGKVLYRNMAAAYGEVAEYVGLPVCEVQAITWLTWRREKNVAKVWRVAA